MPATVLASASVLYKFAAFVTVPCAELAYTVSLNAAQVRPLPADITTHVTPTALAGPAPWISMSKVAAGEPAAGLQEAAAPAAARARRPARRRVAEHSVPRVRRPHRAAASAGHARPGGRARRVLRARRQEPVKWCVMGVHMVGLTGPHARRGVSSAGGGYCCALCGKPLRRGCVDL